MTAQIAAPVARPQPAGRSGIAELAAESVAGRTNVRMAALAPTEKYPLNTPGEERAEAHDRHRSGGEPRAAGAQCPERDERAADTPKCEVGEQARSRRPCELGQDEQRKGSDGREQRRRLIPDHLVRKREHPRCHDRRARGALESCPIHDEER
jgi:hypothetical protein